MSGQRDKRNADVAKHRTDRGSIYTRMGGGERGLITAVGVQLEYGQADKSG